MKAEEHLKKKVFRDADEHPNEDSKLTYGEVSELMEDYAKEKAMTLDEFQEIIVPLNLLPVNHREWLKIAVRQNYKNWYKEKHNKDES